MILLGMGLNALLIISGAYFFVVLGLGSALALIFGYHLNISAIAIIVFDGVDSYILLAMPLFILAGTLLNEGGGVARLMKFVDALTGHLRGGLFVATAAFCAVFSALSGSGYATCAAAGSIMIPQMLKRGYTEEHTGGMVASAATLGNLIPPSIFFVLFGALSQTPVAGLFAAGMVPGLIIAAGLATVGVVIAKRKRFPLQPAASWKVRGTTFVKAIPALLMPIFVLGGIYSGFFTPTEAAAMSVLYAIIIGALIYRGFTWKNLQGAFIYTIKMVAVMYFILVGVVLFNNVIARIGLPQILLNGIIDIGLSPLAFILMLNVLVIALGFFIDPWAVAMMLIPMLTPIFKGLDINMVWIGVLFAINVLAGECTPPMSIMIYITAKVGNIPAAKIIKGIWPFIVVNFGVLFLVTFFPEIALFLPRLFGLL